MGLGNAPARYDVALLLTGLNRVLEYQPEDLTTTVQAGLTLATLDAELRKEGQFLPLDPVGYDRTTLGGVQASAASGPLRHRYGTARDQTIGIRVVHADGTITKAGGKVVKNVTGYDMNKLYIGSLGTLGIIVEASLKVMPLPASEGALLAFFPSIETAGEAALGVMGTSLDTAFLSLVAGEAVHELPGGRSVDGAAALAVGAFGQAAPIARVLRDATAICNRNGAAEVATVSSNEVTNLRRVLAEAPRGGSTTLMARLGVRPESVAGLIQSMAELSNKYSFNFGAVAHISHGIVHSGWTGKEGLMEAQRQATFIEEARDVARAEGGYLVLESAPPGVRALVDSWGDARGGQALMSNLKQQFDPTGVLNPGRFVGGI
ncbi:MAG: glycolate oxidase FAD binding subunit [Chloroflexi bacterium]|jgi:glycolate oxidase FAD binding subunit|nr:MAG: glycolate oxidase FAD binding subunit [Chloroflexota bacterium]